MARILLAMGAERKLRILCAREIQKSIKDSVHALLADSINVLNMSGFYTITENSIRGINGTEFIFRGLKHNVRDLKSLEGVDICWIEEAENVSDQSWEILIPTIRKDGSEIWLTMNVKNVTDPTYKRFITASDPDIAAVKISWRDNHFFPDTLRKEMERLKKTDYEAYLHIWEGEPDTRRSGAVYAKQLSKARDDGRIGGVPYNPGHEVFTAWDLGFGDATAIWWLQVVGRQLHWIDYYENAGEQLDHYVKVIKGRGYNYSSHYLPHDGAHGNIRGDNVSLQLTNMGLPNIILPRESDITPGIELVRQTLAYSCFDSKRCVDGLHALESYAYEWDDNLNRFKDKPRKDWSTHGADAARYACRAAKEIAGALSPPSQTYRPYTYNQSSWMG